MDTTLTRLQKKLDRWELEHLRQHVSDLATRLEMAEERLTQEEANADYWREQHMAMMRDLTEQGHQIGLTQDGELILLGNQGDLIACALEKAEGFLIGFEDDPDQDVQATLASVRAALLAVREVAA